jgi:hypothetical protein
MEEWEERIGEIKLKKHSCALIFLIMLLTACQSDKKREYISWGEADKGIIERLENGGVDYKVENGKVYIPKDQMSKATSCCT